MTADLLDRARAILSMVEGGQSTPWVGLAQAVISCCHDLVDTGESEVAVRLASSLACKGEVEPSVWLRIGQARARALTLAGRLSESLEVCDSIIAEYENHEVAITEDFVIIKVLRAANLWQLNRVDEAIEILSTARRALLAKPDGLALSMCSLHMTWSFVYNGNHPDARQFALESVVSARRCGRPYYEAAALVALGWIYRSSCRWQMAAETVEEALRICDMHGYKILACHCLRSLAIIAWKRGRLDEAQDACSRQLSISSAYQAWYGTLLRGLIHLHGGSTDLAMRDFSETTEIKGGNPTRDTSRGGFLAAEFIGDAFLEQSKASEALAYYDELAPKALALVPKGDIVAELRRRRAECFYLLGRHDEAYTEAKTGLEHCRELGDRYEEAATYRVLALSAAALGNAAEAKRWFDQGFAYYDDIETPYEWGKLWMAYGDWLRGQHAAEFLDRTAALEAYHAARGHFEHMGAQAKLAEATARIAEMTDAQAPPTRTPKPAPPRRVPRGTNEVLRRSKWAFEVFKMVTANKQLLHLLEDVDKLARSRAPILILGESGTGKELIAQGVHQLSGRKGMFMPINCGALPRDVIESELFGHTSGAFTGAAREKAGLFEVCEGGTVFLDEIGEMPMELQARLLRFLESGELRRVGATKNTSVDTRVVAATNRDQATLERGEHLRQDLFYRLAHAVVALPPLRQRGDDVELLAQHFLELACSETGKDVILTLEAMARLRVHSWPGNVRELLAVIKRIVILAPNPHDVTAAELRLGGGSAPTTLLEELAQSERARIAEALAGARGSKTDAARALGIPRTTLINKIRRYGLG